MERNYVTVALCMQILLRTYLVTYLVLWTHISLTVNGMLIGSSVFARLPVEINRQTHDVCSNRPHLRDACDAA